MLGVFLGSAAWWLLLTGTLAIVRERLPNRLLRSINALSGLALVGFGVVAIMSVSAKL